MYGRNSCVAFRRLRSPASVRPVRGRPDASDVAETRPLNGDALIEDLYTRHGAALVAYVHGLGINLQRAEDIVQETMVRAWRHGETLDPTTGAIRGWLHTVARHIVIDRLRTGSAMPAGIEPSVLEAPVDDHQASIIDRVTVLDALARLSPEHRVAVVEIYYGGRTVDSVAASIGATAGTIKSRLHYGLRHLRRILDTEGVVAPARKSPSRELSVAARNDERRAGQRPAAAERPAPAPPVRREESREN